MSKRPLIIYGILLSLFILLFIRSLVMDVSLPGASVVNLHLLQQQQQLFNFSLLGSAVAGFFFFREWRTRGRDLVQSSKEAIEEAQPVETLTKGFSWKRMVSIVVLGVVLVSLASIGTRYMEQQRKKQLFNECMALPHGDTPKAVEAHEGSCVDAAYLS